jgi:hypothetical protein
MHPQIVRDGPGNCPICGMTLVLVVLGIGYASSGAYDVGADAPHSRPVHALLDTLRQRSIAARSAELTPPDLTNEPLISSGAGNYDAMCVGCYLAPSMNETELSRGLYPQPPNLSQVVIEDSAEGVLGDQAWHQGVRHAGLGQEHGGRIYLGHGGVRAPSARSRCRRLCCGGGCERRPFAWRRRDR